MTKSRGGAADEEEILGSRGSNWSGSSEIGVEEFGISESRKGESKGTNSAPLF